MTCHLHHIREVRSCAFFSKSSRWMFSRVPDADSVIMSLLALWPCEERSHWFMSVSKRRWLIRDSRWEAGKPAMAENGTSWTVSRVSFVWSICWAFLCMISWQMEGFVQRHISFGAGTSRCRLRFTILCIYRSRDKLDKPGSYKVGATLFALISSACKSA